MKRSMFAGMALALLLMAQPGAAQVVETEEHRLRVVKLVEGLEHPWSLDFLPDDRMLVTERAGRLRMVRDGRLLPDPVAGLPPIEEHGQGGLLDVALHPCRKPAGLFRLRRARPGRAQADFSTMSKVPSRPLAPLP